MASKPVFQVEGGRQLRRTLRQAGDDLQDLKAAHLDAAQVVLSASAALAPSRTGRLKQTLRAAGTKTQGIVRAGKKAVPYAGPIHWGWPKRNIRANPFIATGAKNSEGQWVRKYENHVENILNKIEGV